MSLFHLEKENCKLSVWTTDEFLWRSLIVCLPPCFATFCRLIKNKVMMEHLDEFHLVFMVQNLLTRTLYKKESWRGLWLKQPQFWSYLKGVTVLSKILSNNIRIFIKFWRNNLVPSLRLENKYQQLARAFVDYHLHSLFSGDLIRPIPPTQRS